MCRTARRHSPKQWPFWLLLGAWFCANSPQTAVFTVLTWMAEARSFPHQQRLAVDVAHVLSGEKPSSPVAPVVAQPQEKLPVKPRSPSPANVVLKKIELSLEKRIEVLPAVRRASRHHEVSRMCPEPRRCAPPHGPPRDWNAA